MTIGRFLRILPLFISFASPALLCAQFQEPTKDELQMTEDAKAPDAAAVYLYREETTDDAYHFHSYYVRIKVLSEKGKEHATVRIPYEVGEFTVSDIQGRTIHSDGTIIPLTAKPTDLMAVKVGDIQVNTMVFTLPSAEIGSILEYRLQLRYKDNKVSEPTWQIQQPLFVHRAHYLFYPAHSGSWITIMNSRGQALNELMYATTMVSQDKVVYGIHGRFTVDLTDIPATPDEDWMPPLNTINQRVSFYYTYAKSKKDFWDTEEKEWAKDTERFTKPAGKVKQAAEKLVAASDTDEQKARKIYAAVMKLDNTDFSREKSKAERKAERLKTIKNAEDVWKQQSGSADDIAMLYVALARAAGLKVWPLQVVDRSRAIFDSNYLSASQLDDYIAVLDIGGKEIFLDPGQKMCPFGLLHWKHTLASGLRLSESGTVMTTTPAGAYTTAVLTRIGDLQMDSEGEVKGTVRIAMVGPEALRWRQMALENDLEEVKKQFRESIREDMPEGVQAEFEHFAGLDDPNVDLIAMVNISGHLGAGTGKHYFLPGLFFQTRSKHPFVASVKRTTPVDVQYASMTRDDVMYHFPAGFTLESAPQTPDINWPDHALYKIRTLAKDGSVEVARISARSFCLLDPQEYSGLHDFYQKVAAADQQQLVLARNAVAKGN